MLQPYLAPTSFQVIAQHPQQVRPQINVMADDAVLAIDLKMDHAAIPFYCDGTILLLIPSCLRWQALCMNLYHGGFAGRRSRCPPSFTGMARLSIRIDFEPSGSALGPGMAQLLECIIALGSIRRAAAAMGMSYRKAWLLIQEVQKTFNDPVVKTEAGGVSGGGTELTELGNTLLMIYRRVESRATDATDADLKTLSAMVRANAAPRRAGRHKRASKKG
jgi:molybdate transport system regulatory protein